MCFGIRGIHDLSRNGIVRYHRVRHWGLNAVLGGELVDWRSIGTLSYTVFVASLNRESIEYEEKDATSVMRESATLLPSTSLDLNSDE